MADLVWSTIPDRRRDHGLHTQSPRHQLTAYHHRRFVSSILLIFS